MSGFLLGRPGLMPGRGRVKLVAWPIAGLFLTVLFWVYGPSHGTGEVVLLALMLIFWGILLMRSLRAGIVPELHSCTLVYRGLIISRRYRVAEIAEFGLLDAAWWRGVGTVITVRKWGSRRHVWLSLGEADSSVHLQFLSEITQLFQSSSCELLWDIDGQAA